MYVKVLDNQRSVVSYGGRELFFMVSLRWTSLRVFELSKMEYWEDIDELLWLSSGKFHKGFKSQQNTWHYDNIALILFINSQTSQSSTA